MLLSGTTAGVRARSPRASRLGSRSDTASSAGPIARGQRTPLGFGHPPGGSLRLAPPPSAPAGTRNPPHMLPPIPRHTLRSRLGARVPRSSPPRARAFSASPAAPIASSSSAPASASSSSASLAELAFPSKPNPTPFEIFHLDHRAPVDPKALKARFYQLSRLYHPDLRPARAGAGGKGKGKAEDGSEKFRQVVEAYEVLKDPRRRAVYLRSGRAGAGGGGGGSGAASWNDQAYSFRRGRPMQYGGTRYGRGEYPSASWDWRLVSLHPSPEATRPPVCVCATDPRSPALILSPPSHSPPSLHSGDPYNPHFRPGASSQTNASTPGWSSSGTLAKNSTVFLVLLTCSALLSPLTFWTTMPESAYAAADSGNSGSPNSLGYDRRHWDAVKNLEKARREAKDGGVAKREAIRSVALGTRRRAGKLSELEEGLTDVFDCLCASHRRRVQEIELERQAQRALATPPVPHPPPPPQLSLPPPSSRSPPPASPVA